MGPLKLDFTLEQIEQHQLALAGIKAGATVVFVPGEAPPELCVTDQSGFRLGSVPAQLQQLLVAEPFSSTVRSCRRAGDKVIELAVRAVATGHQPEQTAALQDAGLVQNATAPNSQADILEGTTQLPQSQLELLVADESLRSHLKDARLQKQILQIDKAPDREKALQEAFQNPDFKSFADKVLGVVAVT